MKRFSTLMILLCAVTLGIMAQSSASPVKWRFAVKMTSPTEGQVTVTARIQDGWHIYGLKPISNGPVPTTIDVAASKGVRFTDNFKPSVNAVEKVDKSFNMKIGMWSGNVSFVRHFKLTGDVKDAVIKCSVKYMACDDTNCMPPKTQNFEYKVKPYSANTK